MYPASVSLGVFGRENVPMIELIVEPYFQFLGQAQYLQVRRPDRNPDGNIIWFLPIRK